MPHLLIIEDDKTLASSLTQGLRENGFDATPVHTLEAASHLLAKGSLDLILLDLGLPDGDGFDFLSQHRNSPGTPPILITTARGELDERLRGLEGGAEDYLVKPFAFAELLARVRVLLRRTQQFSENLLRLADLKIDLLARRASRKDRQLDLTPREFDLLVHLALAQGNVVTREMLAREVWKVTAWTPSMDNVIDVHVSRLREKLDRTDEARLLQTVRGVGFALKEAL